MRCNVLPIHFWSALKCIKPMRQGGGGHDRQAHLRKAAGRLRTNVATPSVIIMMQGRLNPVQECLCISDVVRTTW